MKRTKTLYCCFFAIISILCYNKILIGKECNEIFTNYRYNPFQFQYKEYKYKAKISSVEHDEISLTDKKKISTFGINFSLPNKFIKKIDNQSNSRITITSHNKKAIIINKENEKLMGCSNEKEKMNNLDFCSSFSSTEEFYHKLFTLTPDDLIIDAHKSTGNHWIVHRKGIMLHNVSNIKIYNSKDFTVYRMDLNNKKNVDKK